MDRADNDNGQRVDIAVFLLDFVVIALGAAMLLLIMIPNSEGSEQYTLDQNSQLGAVRLFLAETEEQKSYQVSGALWARLPGLVEDESSSGTAIERVSSDDVGRPLGTLSLSQRVRRVEVIVECAEVSVGQRGDLLERLQQRGVDHIVYQCAGVGADLALSSSSASIGLAGLPTAVAQAMSLWPADRQNPVAAALQEAVLNLGSSATPNEPVLVVFKSPEFLTALILAMAHDAPCPASGLHLIGPPLNDPTRADDLVNILTLCGASNVQYSDGIR